MRNRIHGKRIGYIGMTLLLFVLVFASCTREEEGTRVEPTTVPILTVTLGGDELPPNGYDPTKNRELFIYSVDAESKELFVETAVVSGESALTPMLLLDTVTDSLEDQSYYVTIDEVETEGTTLIVSFSAEAAPAVGCTEQEERLILDAIAQSVLDNLNEYGRIIFRIQGEAYVSENLSFDKDAVYMEE